VILFYVNSGTRRFGDKPYFPFARLSWEFYAVVSGSCGLLLKDNEKAPLRQSHLWLLPPSFVHGWHGISGKPCKVVAFHFASIPRQLEEVVPRGGYFERPLNNAECKVLKRIEALIEKEFRKPNHLSDLRFQRALMDLTLLALEGTSRQQLDGAQQKAAAKVDSALSWFRQNLREHPTLEDVAKAVHVSPSHLRRLFAEVQNQSPSEAMHEIKMQAATQALSATDAKIDVIATECGFSSASVFCRSFKISKGWTPAGWRRRMQS
jgi:AraC family transcriptional regulator